MYGDCQVMPSSSSVMLMGGGGGGGSGAVPMGVGGGGGGGVMGGGAGPVGGNMMLLSAATSSSAALTDPFFSSPHRNPNHSLSSFMASLPPFHAFSTVIPKEEGGMLMGIGMGKDGEMESGSGSGQLEGASCDEEHDDDFLFATHTPQQNQQNSQQLQQGSHQHQHQQQNGTQNKKKRYHRHTVLQIQEMETLFKECPHPDDKQRLKLSHDLGLKPRQVKFWFQNRRTQMKTQLERHENALLRRENEKLKMENMAIREAMRSPMCQSCGGHAALGEVSVARHQLRLENARLRDELDRVAALTGRFVGRPASSQPVAHLPPHMADSSLELAVGGNGFAGVLCLIPAISCALSAVDLPPARPAAVVGGVADGSPERSMLADLALSAMEELVKKAQAEEPLWVRDGFGREVFDEGEYLRTFSQCVGQKPVGFVAEATRATGMVFMSSSALVETLMDANRWPDLFPSLVAKTTSTTDVVCTGVEGTRDGELQLMRAELQVVSPLVPAREVSFLRFCKEHAHGVWAVVDVSVAGVGESPSAPRASVGCRRLPSGCTVQDMANGYSKVTWVEHAEYDESGLHLLYRPLLRSGMALGAQRWVATLQRQCECLAVLMSSVVPSRDLPVTGITVAGRRSMLKLAQRMTANFCAGVCASSVHSWAKLNIGAVGEDVRVMTRKSENDPGEPPGVVLSAATSVWLPVPPHRLFDFLRDESLRSEWDILSNGGPMTEMAHIAKGQDQGNAVSLLRASAGSTNQSSMLILQETCTDASGSLVVYAPVDIPAMHLVMTGGDSSCVALLPSGFAILPDGPEYRAPQQLQNGGYNDALPTAPDAGGSPSASARPRVGGSLLTVAFQILVNSLPTAKLTVESVETVNNLISCTVQKIKVALHCESQR
uniref:Homeobox-leucine zipper protein ANTHOCYANINLESS 2 n=1 Tax=Anthurium amnicola TaxID=1678845 RepID=A0A1D1YD22_9ARAE